MSYAALEGIKNQSLNMILANEEAQTRPYQYYVTVCLSVPLTKQFLRGPGRHGSVGCLSECCYGDHPGEEVWNTVYCKIYKVCCFKVSDDVNLCMSIYNCSQNYIIILNVEKPMWE